MVVYLGSLAALLLTSLWTQDSFTAEVVRIWTLDNFRAVLTEPLYHEVLLRTVLVAAAVTLIDLALALPIAFYMAKVARPRVAKLLVVACLMPLWASYLIKAYAWRLLVIKDGVFEHTFGGSPGLGLVAVVMTLSYLWLPFMILPVYAGLERVPDSHLEASEDLGGRPWRTFRSVVWPAILPSVIAGSIFTFSLTSRRLHQRQHRRRHVADAGQPDLRPADARPADRGGDRDALGRGDGDLHAAGATHRRPGPVVRAAR